MKIRNLIVLSFIGLFIGFISCRDDFDYDLASDNLSFSNDTVNLDTIFNHTNSQTYKLTVHNNQDKDVEIPRIYLSRGEGSFFKINVDGTPGYEFENVAVRKNDSILIFLEIGVGEVLVNSNYEDEINFETTAGTQQVKLISYLEKAKFYNPDQNDDYLLTETEWNNEWSRVIFGNVNVPQNNTLNIQAGTKIYFHHDAGLTINGTLNVNGDINNKVIFRTDRMDERSETLPDTWNKIYLESAGSNLIQYAIIKGANRGLEVRNSNLNLYNTEILNNQEFGLLAYNSNITGRNLVISNSDIATLGLEGGTYDFRHCTFANYFNIGQGSGNAYSLILSNDASALDSAKFYNNIFYGSPGDAIFFDNVNNNQFNYSFENNVIRNESGTINFSGSNNFTDPQFVNPEYEVNDLRLLDTTEVVGVADSSYLDEFTTTDIKGVARPSANITPGAYQTLVNPDELE